MTGREIKSDFSIVNNSIIVRAIERERSRSPQRLKHTRSCVGKSSVIIEDHISKMDAGEMLKGQFVISSNDEIERDRRRIINCESLTSRRLHKEKYTKHTRTLLFFCYTLIILFIILLIYFV